MAAQTEISNRIKRIRKDSGLTFQAMADKFNATAPFELTTCFQDLWKYENGVNMPPAAKYEKILAIGGE